MRQLTEEGFGLPPFFVPARMVDVMRRGMEGRVEFLIAAQMLGESQRPGVLVVGGQSVTCARGGEEYELERDRGGFENRSEVRVRVRKELLWERPKKREKVTLDGRRFTVDDVAGRAGDVAWSITLLKDGKDL